MNKPSFGAIFSLKTAVVLGLLFTQSTWAQHACIDDLGMGNQQVWWTGASNAKYLMDFTGGAPVLSNSGIGQTTSIESTAVYTTPAGDLLLYTDGNAIFNGQTNGLIGTGVGGDPSATEAALIVPDPNGVPTNDFYVFGNTGDTDSALGPINYTLVDIADDSIGSIEALDGGRVFSESLATIPHANGTDFWILSVTNVSPSVNSYEVTDTGVNNTPVSSAITGLPAGTRAHRGTIIYHPPTGQLAISFYSDLTNTGFIFTADFNESTGAVSNFTQHATGQLGYGVAFSPDASKLYYSVGREGFEGSIIHYDIATTTATTIQSGRWAMPRLAPDGKVYVVSFFNGTTMGVINSPNNAFDNIDWNPTGVALPAGSSAAFSLVNQTYAPCNILNENEPPTAAFTYSCTNLSCDFDGSDSSDSDGTVEDWDWGFGDGDNGTGEMTDHTFAASGTYTVTLTVTDDDNATDETSQRVTVTVPAPPLPEVPVPTLSPWGILLLTLSLALLGVFTIRKPF